MTIASAITAAQGRVADCYTSVNTKGGTIPETQNLTNLPAAIESIPQGGGGGDTVLAVNKTGQTLTENDKVLLRYALPDTSKKQEFSIAATSSTTGGQTYVQPVWFNENLFCVFAGFNGEHPIGSFSYQYNGSTWNKTAITGTHNQNGYKYGTAVQWVKNIGMTCRSIYCEGGGMGRYHTIDSSGQFLSLGHDVIGKMMGILYSAVYASSTSATTYGIYADSTRIATDLYASGHFLDIENKRILYSRANVLHLLELSSDGMSTTTNHNLGDIGTKCFIGCTGLGVGDYIFFATDKDKEKCNNCSIYNASTNLPYGRETSSYSVYKINADLSIGSLSASDSLYSYTNISRSLWRFDNRNNCLVIGTGHEVFVLEFNSTTKTWKQIVSLSDVLPNNYSGEWLYNASLSPEKSRLVVYAGDTYDQAQNLFIYDLGTDEIWSVVENTIQNYDSVYSFTGVATGTQETVSGVTYDVITTVLPPQETVTCSFTFEESTVLPELSIV